MWRERSLAQAEEGRRNIFCSLLANMPFQQLCMLLLFFVLRLVVLLPHGVIVGSVIQCSLLPLQHFLAAAWLSVLLQKLVSCGKICCTQ